ncbi:MAG: hypothetical protein IT221_03555 [Fluviicola sp.]|nr:hypothetical protein [Fluviicola sp.]
MKQITTNILDFFNEIENKFPLDFADSNIEFESQNAYDIIKGEGVTVLMESFKKMINENPLKIKSGEAFNEFTVALFYDRILLQNIKSFWLESLIGSGQLSKSEKSIWFLFSFEIAEGKIKKVSHCIIPNPNDIIEST